MRTEGEANLHARVLSAGIVISVLTILIWLDVQHNFGQPGIWLGPLMVAGAVLACGETLSLFRAGGHNPPAAATYAGVLAVVGGACIPVYWGLFGAPYPDNCPLGKMGWPMVGLAAGVGMALISEMRRFHPSSHAPGRVTVQVALSVFVMAYIGVCLSFLAPLRLMHSKNEWGLTALLSLIIIVKFGDTGAYLIGRKWGRRKLAPSLSPGKTIEGVLGGLLFAAVASWLVFQFLAPWLTGEKPQSWWRSIVYGLLLAGVGVVADLAESLLKRDAQQKDSSSWLPGLGGVLDMLDSLLLTAPAAFLCWAAGLVGPPS